jgi:hypothetical protein
MVCGFSQQKSRAGLSVSGHDRIGMTPAAVVVTSAVRPECLDGIAFTSQSENSVGFGPGFMPKLAEPPARETRKKMALMSSDTASPSAPNLSGFPGTGAILF